MPEHIILNLLIKEPQASRGLGFFPRPSVLFDLRPGPMLPRAQGPQEAIDDGPFLAVGLVVCKTIAACMVMKAGKDVPAIQPRAGYLCR